MGNSLRAQIRRTFRRTWKYYLERQLNIIPIVAKDQARLHKLGKKNPPKHLCGICATCGVKLEMR